MRIEPAFLQNKVARRVFTLFVVSAVVPVVITVLLAVGQLSGPLEQSGYRELANTGKSYGMSVFERLHTLEGATAAMAAELAARRPLKDVIQVGARLHFQSIRMARRADLVLLSPAVRRRLERGAMAIAIVPAGVAEARVSLLRRLDPKRPGLGTLIAEPDPAYLWGERDALPYLTDICVLDPDGRALFCSHPVPAAIRVAFQTRAADEPRLAWHDAGQELAASYWTLFLDGSFGTPSWTVIASRPKAALRAPLERFWAVILPVLVVSLLLVVLLTVTQVRRWLVPLELLTQATRRIGNRDFSTTVNVRTGDEFEELSHALNSMAARLGRQFSALVTWSEADRVILSDPRIDRVLETVLNRLPDMVPADVLSVTVLEDPKLGLARTYARSATAGTRVIVERTELSVAEINRLTTQSENGAVCAAGEMPAFLGIIGRMGAKSMCILPVILKGALVAVIGIGYRDAPSLSEDDHVHVRNVADRVAVALLAVEREKQLYRQAHYDPLTGLPNRLYIEDRLKQEIAHARRENQPLALLFIDLDRFKDINDTLGHAAGDNLLRQAAARLQGCVRAVDTVARLGGDEFVIVLTGIGSPRGAQVAAENAIRVLSHPIEVGDRETFMSCSIGVTLFPEDGATGEELLRKADTAMYRAKQNGRGRYVFFEERMNIEALDRVALEQDLRRALARDEFVLRFQPQVDLRSGTVVGAEMLVRWAHPTRGALAPDQFISVAENAGLIESVGEHLLRKACAQHSRWRSDGLAPGRLAVNVSARQLRQSNFWDIVHRALTDAGVPAASLELEITESLLLEDAPEVAANFSRLEDMGVRLAIDDFGMGYSSLAYLKRLPIHAVKIDRAFIREIPGSDDAGTIVNTIIAMARSLRKEVIAEGVETGEQAAFLLASGCHLAQGFGISRPLPADEFAAYLRTQREARPGLAP